MRGVIETVIEEIQKFVNSNGALVGMGIGTVAAAGGGGLLALIPAFLLILIILRELLEQFDEDIRLSEHMEIISAALLRSEEHTSELQSLRHLVCRLLLEK